MNSADIRRPTPDTLPLSVLIPVKNEEMNLPACFASLTRAAEIFVVDSHSIDRTVEIAEGAGAIVMQFEFSGGWPKKKNWALDKLPFRYEWVLIVDADERIPPDLWNEMAIAIQDDRFDGYHLKRKVIFLGRWLRHGGKYPDLNLRLFRHRLGRYENLQTQAAPQTGDNEVHEHVILERDGIPIPKSRIGLLKTPMLHEDFRDLYHWIDRHNRYSNWEAQLYLNFLEGRSPEGTIRSNFFGNPLERKRFLRRLWVWLPFRPTIRFLTVYFLMLGFLDGKAGYIHARLISQYEYQISVKLYELRRRRTDR
ncbi:glycosyltransferase family 2 protein [Microcoleus sp. FACHB-1515]|uniref:glycosyltransferase family 2 protein n=1 Tax=Cyanophyceae TaxID=3028117 RepID=UPI001689D4EC|nr:glycosyltransferase family 2 protein [Microcoleus sp. FACHB-1515]MBD2092245.1 glycosyltransferase family 2 protein [Microcoleus sp. FACHB-1515]